MHEFGPSFGRTVVAVHGVTGSGNGFRRLAERLPDFRFVCPDLRGHGFSAKDPPWDLSVHLRDLRETFDGLGIARAPFIGFSFGGRIGVELVASDRSRIERLVLLDPALQVSPKGASESADANLTDTSYASVDDAIEQRMASGFAPYAPRDHWEMWAEPLVQGEDGRWRLPFSRSAAITMWSEMATPPPSFDRCRLPTLLIVGAESDMVTPKQIERYTYELADFLEVKTVHATHQVIGDATADVAAAIGRFLAQ